tara:strand:+ start:481 stop:714 length:234 start_codon:yes stop_codon:yes gene_type:complete
LNIQGEIIVVNVGQNLKIKANVKNVIIMRKKKMKAIEIGDGKYWLKEVDMKDFSDDDLDTLSDWVLDEIDNRDKENE